jgi:hypothetical protein
MNKTNYYTKDEFIQFLNNNNANDETIIKFNSLRETIKDNNSEYKLNIIVRIGKNNKSYDLNYYSGENVKFLFPYKIFNNVDSAIDYLYTQEYSNEE